MIFSLAFPCPLFDFSPLVQIVSKTLCGPDKTGPAYISSIRHFYLTHTLTHFMFCVSRFKFSREKKSSIPLDKPLIGLLLVYAAMEET